MSGSEATWLLVGESDGGVVAAPTADLSVTCLLVQQGLRARLCDQHQRMGLSKRTLIVSNQIRRALASVPHETVVNHIPETELSSQAQCAVVILGALDLVLERDPHRASDRERTA